MDNQNTQMPLDWKQVRSLLKYATGALAIAAVLGFIIAYTFEAGFATFFNIPRFLIPPSFNQLIDSLLSLSWRVISLLFPSILIPFILCLIPEKDKNNWSLGLVISGVILVLLFFYLNYKYYIDRGISLRELVFVWVGVVSISLLLNIKFHPSDNALPKIISIFILILPVAYCFGRFDAMTQPYYFTRTNNNGTSNENVVLRIYGDKFISAQYQHVGNSNKVDSTFTIIKITGESEQQFNLSNLGPLKPYLDGKSELTRITKFAIFLDVLGFLVFFLGGKLFKELINQKEVPKQVRKDV